MAFCAYQTQRYNSAGQLFCVLCNTPVKSAILWDSHVLGKKHKENLAIFKGNSNKGQTVANIQLSAKEKTYHKIESTHGKPDLKRSNQDKVSSGQNTPEKKSKVDTSHQHQNSSKEEEEECITDSNDFVDGKANLPSDFFDTSQQSEQTTKNLESSGTDSIEGIPEGFFDDPKLDAKVRKVEYKDAAEEEWEKFQKAMQVESQVSQSIVEVEDEESRVDREFSELSEQRLYFLRADVLRDKQSTIKEKLSTTEAPHRQSQDDNSSNSDGSDYEEFFDWRAKKVFDHS